VNPHAYADVSLEVELATAAWTANPQTAPGGSADYCRDGTGAGPKSDRLYPYFRLAAQGRSRDHPRSAR